MFFQQGPNHSNGTWGPRIEDVNYFLFKHGGYSSQLCQFTRGLQGVCLKIIEIMEQEALQSTPWIPQMSAKKRHARVFATAGWVCGRKGIHSGNLTYQWNMDPD